MAKSERNSQGVNGNQAARAGGFAVLLLLVLLLIAVSQVPSSSLAGPEHGETPTPIAAFETILSDGQFVYGPNVGLFETGSFLNSTEGVLKNYSETIECQANYYSLNPKVVIAIIEMQSGLVTNPGPSLETIEYAIGYDESGLEGQIRRLSESLFRNFYWHLYGYQPRRAEIGEWLELNFADGSRGLTSGSLNAGTYAVQAALAEVLTPDRWRSLVSTASAAGFYQTYLRLFPDDEPLDTSNVISVNATPPSNLLKLPFACGDTWPFTGGPHAWDGIASNPWSSLDFGSGSCTSPPPTNKWVAAAASGTAYVSCNGCQIRIDHTGGWRTYYYHLINPQVSSGSSVSKDRRLANPSCRPSAHGSCGDCGGTAYGIHVHFAINLNGVFQPIDGTSLEGWIVHKGTSQYKGYLQKGSSIVPVGGWVTSYYLSAPSNLSASVVSPCQMNLSWRDNSNCETGFKIYRDGSHIATVGANITSYQNTGLKCGTPYSYYVKAYNSGWVSGASNTASATTQSCPAAPSNLSASAVSPSQINLSWKDNSTNESGFKIYRAGSLIATVGANVTSYQNTGLTCGTTYSYYVKAYNCGGESGASNTASAKTHSCNNAQFISQNVPSSMVAGQSYPVSITMKNTGTTTWTQAGAYKLGSQNPENNLTWGLGRAQLDSSESVAPGAQKTFAFTVTAPPTPGSYNFQWRMVQEDVEWFGDYSPNVIVSVTAPTPTKIFLPVIFRGY